MLVASCLYGQSESMTASLPLQCIGFFLFNPTMNPSGPHFPCIFTLLKMAGIWMVTEKREVSSVIIVRGRTLGTFVCVPTAALSA